MRVARRALAALSLAAALAAAACSGRTVIEGAGGSAGGGASSGGAGGVGSGGQPCATPEGVRLCGGTASECAWVPPDACPGGGCTRPYDRLLGGPAQGGACLSDLADNASRTCMNCDDGEVCLERRQGELYCVPESVCAGLWRVGVRGVCRYADLSAYDGRPLATASACPTSVPKPRNDLRCSPPCTTRCTTSPCTGRSADHPIGLCLGLRISSKDYCALDGAKYTSPCDWHQSYCGFFRVSAADRVVASQYGSCLRIDTCLWLSSHLPGGFDCYDEQAQLVKP